MKQNLKYSKKDIDENILKFLSRRNFNSDVDVLSLFENQKLTDSARLTDIKKITERISLALTKKEKIVICGDYDVDGSIATSILIRYFREISYEIDYYIPHRIEEGYGLSGAAVNNLADNGYSLLISVDNGISAFEAAEVALKRGVDLIITDHHDIVNNQLPNAFATLNPKRDNIEKSKFISGAGLAFYLINQINKDLGFKVNLKPYLVLAMIASITDVVPLLDDNRIIVKYGLSFLSNNMIPGLKKLFSSVGLTKSVTAKDIGFKIGPVLNAAGRLGGAEKTVKLLIEDDDFKLELILDQLLELNKKRKEISNEAIERSINLVDNNHKVIVIDDFIHPGVIGIVAARIKEKFKKPTIVIGKELNKTEYKASCRSVPGFNIKDAIEKCSSNHLGGGGHYMAAGFSIRLDQIDSFKNEMYKYANSLEFNSLDQEIDLDLDEKKLSKSFLSQIEELEPFGAKFDAPIVNYTGKVSDIKILKNEHLLIKLDKNVNFFIFFAKLKDELNKYQKGSIVSVVGELSVSKNEAKIISIKR